MGALIGGNEVVPPITTANLEVFWGLLAQCGNQGLYKVSGTEDRRLVPLSVEV